MLFAVVRCLPFAAVGWLVQFVDGWCWLILKIAGCWLFVMCCWSLLQFLVGCSLFCDVV